MKVKSLSRAQLLVTPWTGAYQAPPSMGFSRQEYWSGVFQTRVLEWGAIAFSCAIASILKITIVFLSSKGDSQYIYNILMEGRAWWATVHGVAKSQTQLSDFTFTFIKNLVVT